VIVCASCGHANGDAARFCEACGLALGAASGERRKVVTVLFCDVVDSTVLGESTDPEAVRATLARYFERMKGILEHHGGSVEKFIGDAVMAVFGVPVVHEDDALRACRAAVEMRAAFPGLGVEGRIGISTGEVVTGTEERLATGDALNVAARLQQAAQPGEVLLGLPTLALVGEAVDVEPLQPLVLKGKTEPVPAYRLLRVRQAPERQHEALFVGRARELAIVREAWERVRTEQRCELVTLVGTAGVGKSRLVLEFLSSVEATVVRGRCLPYGAGITYWPVVEVLKQLDMLPADHDAAAAIRSLLGESDAGTSAEEIAWAFRKTLEEAAAERAVVVVFDDIQWGEETFRDLIEHVALLSSGASILVLCMARPELTEHHAAWPVALRLEPLADAEVRELIAERVPERLRERIATAAAGNPLFIEAMLAMAGEGDEEVTVPPTLQALLAARLDQLDPAERSVLERAAVEGEIFHRGAVQALAPDETQVTPRLAALVRKELIRPDKPQLLGEDGFRFRHLLLRDAAYDALPKATRADLHERYASWLEQHETELVEQDELLGYHLEQACLYRRGLGMVDDGVLERAARRRLAAGGYRAAFRQDYGAAASLLERATAVVSAPEIDLALEAELSFALLWCGRGDRAIDRADGLVARARAAGDRVGELCGRILGAVLRIDREQKGMTERLAALVDQALPVFEAAGDDLAQYIGYRGLAAVAGMRAQADAELEADEQAFAHARRAGHQPPMLLGGRASGRFFGTTPASKLLAWLDENEPTAGRDQFLRAYRAGTLAMLGHFDEARTILAQQRAELTSRGGGILLANIIAFESVWVEQWAGNPVAAVEFAREGWRLHEELGEQGFLAQAAVSLAQALYALDRLEEADAWAGRAAELGAKDDVAKEMLWRQVRAKVLARHGDHAEAQRIAREAVGICDATQLLNAQGDAYSDLGEVLLLAGRLEDARSALGEAHARYARKENRVSAQRVQARLESLRAEASG
jgi:class 3 adenylate cyclase/tetratricopeptide (TPR) repeat protein